jgi:membrane-associated phospholipid phosphatase
MKRWRWLVHIWAFLIGVSVLTAYQHHFVDVPTGALLGVACLRIWPDATEASAEPVSVQSTRTFSKDHISQDQEV